MDRSGCRESFFFRAGRTELSLQLAVDAGFFRRRYKRLRRRRSRSGGKPCGRRRPAGRDCGKRLGNKLVLRRWIISAIEAAKCATRRSGGGRDDLLSFELPGWNFCFSRSIGSAPASRCQSGSEEPGKRPAGSVCQQYAYSQYRQERKNGSRLQRNGAGGDAPARFSNSAGRGRPAATILSCGD